MRGNVFELRLHGGRIARHFGTSLSPHPDSCAVLPSPMPLQTRGGLGNPTAANVDWLGVSIAETYGMRWNCADWSRSAATTSGSVPASGLKPALAADPGFGDENRRDARCRAGDLRRIRGPARACRRSGDSRGSLKISARIMDRKRLRQSAEFAETGAIEDLSTIEAHLAWQALAIVAPKLAPAGIRIPVAALAHSPGRGGELCPRPHGHRSPSSARNSSCKPRAWTPASPIPNMSWARFITSARSTARPPIGCRKSAPRKSNRIRPRSCWVWRCFNPAITPARRRRCKPSSPRFP